MQESILKSMTGLRMRIQRFSKIFFHGKKADWCRMTLKIFLLHKISFISRKKSFFLQTYFADFFLRSFVLKISTLLRRKVENYQQLIILYMLHIIFLLSHTYKIFES